jgi:hypothetical protein
MKTQLNAKQEAKLNSFRATEQYVDANINVINAIPAFLATYNKIKPKIAAVLENAGLKSASLSGIADSKEALRRIVSDKALAIAGLVYTYAADIGDLVLKDEMDIKSSRLARTRDDELAPLCQFIHDRADTHINALKTDYNLTTGKLAEFQTAIDNYSSEVPKPRNAVSERKIVNANLRTLFKDLGELFKRFDRQIKSLIEEQPDFVNTYFSNREIVDAPNKGNKLKAEVPEPVGQ